MSNSQRHEDPSHIAGEPVQDNLHKRVPEIAHPTASSHQAVQAPIRTKSRWAAVMQTLLVVCALAISTTSYIMVDSVSQQPGEKGLDAHEMLVRIEGRVADSICTEGGAEIIIGSDYDQNGILSDDEVSSTTKVCHGKEGLSGPQGAPGPVVEANQSLLRINPIQPGNESCPMGGAVLLAGIDLSDDGELGDDEIHTANTVCNGVIGSNGINGMQGVDGQTGASALVEQRQPHPSVCPVGIIIEFGIDDGNGGGIAHDGTLQTGELLESLNVCSTPLAYGPITDMASGSANGVTVNCDAMVWMEQQQRILISGVDGVSGCELWVSEGTEATTNLLLDINPSGDALPGRDLSFNAVTTNAGERMFFDADDGVHGRQLWVTDATTTGTQRITDSGTGIVLASHSKLALWAQGVVVLTADDRLVWTNGTDTSSVFSHPMFGNEASALLNNSSAGLSTFATEVLYSNGPHLWFSAKDTQGLEPHLLTTSGDLLSWDLNPMGSSAPSSPTAVGTGAVFVAETNNGRQLVHLFEDGSANWLTSLTHQGTGSPTQHVGVALGIHEVGQYLVFDALTSGVDTTVWSHNLVTGQTQLLSLDILAPGDWAGGYVHGGLLWFDCVAPGVAHEVCTSDGTVEQTKVVTDLRAGIASSNILHFAAHSETLFVMASGQIDGQETGSCLWYFSGTGAQLAYDPWEGSGNNSASGTYGSLVMSEHHALFMSHDGQRGHEVHAWSHGTISGEWLVWS